jgi:hypothetical protein
MADTSLYRITYDTGLVKYGPRRVLGPVLGAMRGAYWNKKPVKIERAIQPVFEDVTTEFIPE